MGYHKFLSFVLTSIAAGLTAAVMVLLLRPELAQPPPPGQGTTGIIPPIQPSSGPASYAQAVSRASPSVVNIYSTKITTQRGISQFESPLLQYFFGDQLITAPRQRLETSLGSGVIFSADGYVLTNNHIVEDADEIKVVLADGRDVAVRVIGTDPETDIAVLKVEANDLPVIRFGDSGRIQVGDVVLAIGNPFGVGQTVTMGIVGATGRSHLGINTYENFIQTDAAINPGNSGGALINAYGELIGINTAIFSKTGSSHGIGFAIPVALATGVMEQLIRSGRVTRAWLGITGQDVTPALAESFGLHDASGVLISGIVEKGPAELSGLRPGDVITVIDGIAPKGIQDLSNLIAGKSPGTQIRVQGWRGNDQLDLIVVPTERSTHPRR